MFKFKRFPRRVGNPIPWSKRRESYAKSKAVRHAKKHAKKMPLFEEELLEEAADVQVDIDEVIEQRQQRSDDWIRRQRQSTAQLWLKARKRFFELSEEQQAEVLRRYNDNRWMPKEAMRLCSIIDEVSGDRAKRVAEAEATFRAYMAQKEKQEQKLGVQANLL